MRMIKMAPIALALLMALSSVAPAGAAVRFNVDVLWNPNPDDSAQVLLHASNEAYPVPRDRVTAVFHEIPDPANDYPVLAFIATNAHVDISTVWEYKRKGHAWTNVMWHFGVPPNALFVELPEDPGPPYARAYGAWRRHGNRMQRDVIDNVDVQYWVRMHALATYAGVPPGQIYQWHHSGQKFETIAVRSYKEKHGGPPEGGPGKGWGKGRSKSH
jgi:hypothetical protein